jgi:hypothetical protein
MTTFECIQYDMMVELGLSTPDELNLVLAICQGTPAVIMDMVVYYRTGYHTFDDYLEAEAERDD